MDEFDLNDTLPPRQRNWVVLLSFGILYLTLDLVRRRKVREDDSWMWLLVGGATFLFGTQYGLLKRISRFLGIVTPTSTIFFFGQFFLMLLAMQTSIRLAGMGESIKNLCQEVALVRQNRLTPRSRSANGSIERPSGDN
ncbi:MAG TPA: DUF2304 domain-containing protein [Candidatus Ozemobacteraceae bacterium]|nr:DUF2304 domain-containing protein [Candidatus Ozemobacteraceae bacterium]